jgi:DNA repair exonuclease SbcCD ATPase subunit
MALTLRNFKIHKDYTLDLTPNDIHLVSGNSGAGKTTLFKAILWSLYGRMNRVKTRGLGLKCRAEVTLTIGNRKIIRKSNPDEFTVVHGEVTLVGESAKMHIHEWLGPREFWMATSYVMQKKPNAFLSATPAQKLDILSQIIFMNGSPGDSIDKVDAKLISIGTEKNILKSHVDILSQQYNEKVSEYSITNDEINAGYPKDALGIPFDQVNTFVGNIWQEIEKEKEIQIAASLKVKERDDLCKKIGCITLEELDSVKRDAEDSISNFDKILAREYVIRGRNDVESKMEKSKREISSLMRHDGYGAKLYTSTDISSVERMESDIRHSKELFSSLEIPYSLEALVKRREDVSDEIRELEERHYRYQDQMVKLRQIEERERQLSQLEESLSKITPMGNIDSKKENEELEELQRDLQKISSFKQERKDEIRRIISISTMSCPHCSNHVYWSGKELVKTKGYDQNELKQEMKEIDDIRKDESEKIKCQITIIRKIIRTNDQAKANVDVIMKHIEQLKENPIPLPLDRLDRLDRLDGQEGPVDLSRLGYLKDMNTKLFHLRYPHVPSFVPSEQMKKEVCNYQYDLLNEGIKKMNDELERIHIPDEVKVRYTKYEAYEKLRWIQEIHSHIKRYEEIKDVTVNMSLITVKEKLMDDIRTRYMRITKIFEVLGIQYNYIQINSKYQEILNTEMGFTQLKEIMINTEYSMYITATNKINLFLKEAVSYLFVEPYDTKILMFKKLKDKGRIKPAVNLYTTLNGEEVDISDLSGGEEERFSMAITMALNKISQSPFLILDETFASLGGEDRERSVNVLRNHGKMKDKYTLCVSHNEVEGWFDKETIIEKKL